MIVLLSSAKTLDSSAPWRAPATTRPECVDQIKELMAALRQLSVFDLRKLMDVSASIAQLNVERHRHLSMPLTPDNAKPALLTYRGDVYRAMQAERFSQDELTFAQQTLRIISGLYGIVRPLDLIQPYRLEMAVALSGPTWTDLYAYWSEHVTRLVDRDARAHGGMIVNLASQEYARVVLPERLTSQWLAVTFQQDRGGRRRMVPILAKRARGLMAGYIVRHRITTPQRLHAFDDEGYQFDSGSSTEAELIFVRRG